MTTLLRESPGALLGAFTITGLVPLQVGTLSALLLLIVALTATIACCARLSLDAAGTSTRRPHRQRPLDRFVAPTHPDTPGRPRSRAPSAGLAA